MEAFSLLCRTEGIIPALESSHALAGALEVGRELGPDGLLLVNLSGRGDKDVDTVADWLGCAPGGAVTEAFEKARRQRRGAGRLPAGRVSPVDGAIEAAMAMAEAGVDVIEIGLPYSDPLMDGPVIRGRAARADHRTRVTDVLRTVEAVAAAGVPTLVMTYWNPVDHYGVRAFARDLAAAGGAGLITPDLTPEEAGPWLDASDDYDLDRVFLVAPSSTAERMATTQRLPRLRLRRLADGHHRHPGEVSDTPPAWSRSASTLTCRSRWAWASATAPRPPRWPGSRTA